VCVCVLNCGFSGALNKKYPVSEKCTRVVSLLCVGHPINSNKTPIGVVLGYYIRTKDDLSFFDSICFVDTYHTPNMYSNVTFVHLLHSTFFLCHDFSM